MQIIASMMKWLRVFLVAALYVSVFGCATAPTPVQVVTPGAKAPVAVAPSVAAPAPAPATPPAPAVVTGAVSAEPVLVEKPVTTTAATEPAAPHIALILPLKSTAFAKAADVVRQGFLAGASKDISPLPVRVYPCVDESTEVTALYQQAIRAGAVGVAGPLTRSGVAALAANAELKTPTVALNTLETSQRNDQLYFFGLPPEAEARQAAHRATDAGLLSAVIVSTNTPLSKRLAQAFADEWERAGGIIRSQITYPGDPTPLKELPQEPGSSVFLAAEADKARLLRPYINSTLPVYATSQIFSGNNHTLTNYDLADVRFFDMPWMLQPDHPAVMIYPRSAAPLTPEMDRLYALGIDAYRLLDVLLERQLATALPLDGVTGKITLDGHQFLRESTPAVMRQGLGMPVESKQRQ